MTYSLDALGDFMQVGPQVYPERPNGVQVIMRGPHGVRFSADPVRTREGQPRGSGFRTWVEQTTLPQNEAWVPQSRVVGLLGFGAPPDVQALDVCGTGAPRLPDFGPAPVDGAVGSPRSMWTALNNRARQACRGNVAGARTGLENDWRFWSATLSESDKAKFTPLVRRCREYIALAESGASTRMAETQARESGHARNMQTWNEKYSAAVNAETQAEVEASRGGPLAYAAWVAKRDPAGAAYAAATGKPPPAWTRDPNTDAGERVARGECVGFDPSCWVKKSWKPVLAVALGGLAVYALASGYGKGLATRGRKGA